MGHYTIAGMAFVLFLGPICAGEARTPPVLNIGFGESDITPTLGKLPVFMAGFGHNRRAAGVHDPLKARALVLRDGRRKLALVSLDLIGFFHERVVAIRQRFPEYDYLLVSSTHNHEGPDTLGLWGPNPFATGVDSRYLAFVEKRIAEAIRAAEKALTPAVARFGVVSAPELLHDAREPYIKHDELVVLEFRHETKPVGLVVQWNCHPETLGKDNALLSADFVGSAVQYLSRRRQCSFVYFTGVVGGLMTSLKTPVRSESGVDLADGTFEKTERYGILLGQRVEESLQIAEPIPLTPWEVRRREIFLPLANPMYLLGRQLGVLQRDAFAWTGNLYQADPVAVGKSAKALCLRTEVAYLRLGGLEVAAIPGEIYPELVLDKVAPKPDPGADYPDAAVEPAIYKHFRSRRRMLIGLANDEIGYIIPKRQWDEKPPYCYGRTKPQYGEINSLGPDTAPLLCTAFEDLVRPKR